MKFDNRFSGRSAVITGGASGIGRKSAERIISEGGRVSLWDLNQGAIDAFKAEFGPSASGVCVNVASAEEVERASEVTQKLLGTIDILVCCAGIAGKNAPVVDYPIEEWKRIFDINVHGLFYCNRALAPLMVSKGYGRIINVASIAGKEGNPTASAYSASKAAVIGFTKSLGKELAENGVTVNTITPATVETPILAQVSPAHIEYMRSKIPMGRFGTTDEIASIITWLASEECSFTTGGVFDVSGGRATY